jgi:hypothetical protein
MRTRVSLAITSAFVLAALVSGCKAKGGGNGGVLGPYPVSDVVLEGTNGATLKTVGSNHTQAWEDEQLWPASKVQGPDPQSLTYDSGAARQELIAFDMDYGSPLSQPDPRVDYVPYAPSFVSLKEGGKKAFTLPYGTHHLVRYWHGACAAQLPWPDLFDQISAGLFDKIVEAAKADGKATSVTRGYDSFSPHFVSRATHIHHGFELEAEYTFGASLGSATFTMNPAYEIHERDLDGLVRVDAIQQRLEPANLAIQEGLATQLPAAIEDTIAAGLTFPLTNPVFDFGCDPKASVEKQQQACFEAVASAGDGSPAHFIFQHALEAAGYGGGFPDAYATLMVGQLSPRNFSCPMPDADAEAQCAFHPIIRRVNVLPDVMELVFARDTGVPGDGAAEEKIFYTLLPDVLKGLGVKGAEQLAFCDKPVLRADGKVTLVEHGSVMEKF